MQIDRSDVIQIVHILVFLPFLLHSDDEVKWDVDCKVDGRTDDQDEDGVRQIVWESLSHAERVEH